MVMNGMIMMRVIIMVMMTMVVKVLTGGPAGPAAPSSPSFPFAPYRTDPGQVSALLSKVSESSSLEMNPLTL